MRSNRVLAVLLVALSGLVAAGVTSALDNPPGRVELKRADLTGAPGMEVISSISEFKPGDQVMAHFHNGIEAGYVVQGAMIQMPGKDPVMMETGSSFMNLRDVVHAGYKVVGDRSLKIFAVHIVDKGKPLYDSKP